MDGVQLSQDYKDTTKRQIIFHYVPRSHLIDLGRMKS